MTDRELLRTGLNEYLSEVSDKTIDNLLKFSELLLEKNKVMNLTAITDPTEVVTRHFLDCAALASHMPQGGRVFRETAESSSPSGKALLNNRD